MLLKRYKNRLKGFDQTLGQIEKSKVDWESFTQLKDSIKKERAVEVFKDMQLLLDSAIEGLKTSMSKDKSLHDA